MKTTIPRIVTLLGGLIVLIEYFFKVEMISSIAKEIMSWGVIIAAFASTLGAVNLLRIHSNNVRKKRAVAPYSYVLLISLFAYLVLGLVTGPKGTLYQFLFNKLLQPLSSTLFACNAFFITSAAYRAFIVRNREAAILLTSAVLVMLGRVGIGEALWSGFPAVSKWIMDIPTGAGMRGIIIGSALGAVAISLRILLGFERSHFAGTN